MGIYTYIPVVKEEVGLPSLFLPWLTILKYLFLYRKRKPHQLSKDSNLCYGSRLLFKFKYLLFYLTFGIVPSIIAFCFKLLKGIL